MIYCLEGPDGTGKSTLATEIAKQKNATVMHPYFNTKWNMLAYHSAFIHAAEEMNDAGINVVLDRWAPSEAVYGKVFRGGEGFDTESLVRYYYPMLPITFIYCRNDNAVENHLRNREDRHEMFDDMSQVVSEFDLYVEAHEWMNWIVYDFDKVNMEDFVTKLP